MQIKDILSQVGEDKIRQAIESDNPDELHELMEDEGISLSDEQLDYIAGGILKPREEGRRLVIRPRKRRVSNDEENENASKSSPGEIIWPDDPNITELP